MMKKPAAFLLTAFIPGTLFIAGTGSLNASRDGDIREEEIREEEMHNPEDTGEPENLPEDIVATGSMLMLKTTLI